MANVVPTTELKYALGPDKKRPKYFCNISYKTDVKWCKLFPPHLNNVSTLPCETWNAATNELSQKETPEFIPPQLWLPNSPGLNLFDDSMWEILQEKVYKTRITDLELSTTPLTKGCRNDDVIQLGSLCS